MWLVCRSGDRLECVTTLEICTVLAGTKTSTEEYPFTAIWLSERTYVGFGFIDALHHYSATFRS